MTGIYSTAKRRERANLESMMLARYACKSSDTLGRLQKEEDNDHRLPFERDRDRVLHSTAFHRLQYKTQVFLLHEGDFYRTRMTHSLEVTQIARSIAAQLRLNEHLVEAIALVHDIGYPPFGNAGELELDKLMTDTGFDHNLQALRIVDELEERYMSRPGINLSWEVREGIVRHDGIFSDSSMIEEFSIYRQPTLEAQVVTIADMIAYCTHEIEDALRVGFLRESDLNDLQLWQEASELVMVDKETNRLLGIKKIRQRETIRKLIDILIRDVVSYSLKLLERGDIKSLVDVRETDCVLVELSPARMEEVNILKEFLLRHVYSEPGIMRMEHKGRRIIRELFKAFMDEPKMLPAVTYELYPQRSLERIVCDYIAGMTDRHAVEIYKLLFDPKELVSTLS